MPMKRFDLFFMDPRVNYSDGKQSNLYLLRREINTVLASKSNPINQTGVQQGPSILLAAMGVMAGIDLLAKFYSGEEYYSNSGIRFQKFVQRYFDNDSADVLYKLRNSLMHNFGLNDDGFKFVLRYENGPMLYYKEKSTTVINVKELHLMFENSIPQFKIEYPRLPSFQRFDALSEKYGFTHLGETLAVL